MEYKTITVQDIVDVIKANPDKFPNGMKTKICSGDFEGNYTHRKHEISCTHVRRLGNTLFLNYEMHEGLGDY